MDTQYLKKRGGGGETWTFLQEFPAEILHSQEQEKRKAFASISGTIKSSYVYSPKQGLPVNVSRDISAQISKECWVHSYDKQERTFQPKLWKTGNAEYFPLMPFITVLPRRERWACFPLLPVALGKAAVTRGNMLVKVRCCYWNRERRCQMSRPLWATSFLKEAGMARSEGARKCVATARFSCHHLSGGSLLVQTVSPQNRIVLYSACLFHDDSPTSSLKFWKSSPPPFWPGGNKGSGRHGIY